MQNVQKSLLPFEDSSCNVGTDEALLTSSSSASHSETSGKFSSINLLIKLLNEGQKISVYIAVRMKVVIYVFYFVFVKSLLIRKQPLL